MRDANMDKKGRNASYLTSSSNSSIGPTIESPVVLPHGVHSNKGVDKGPLAVIEYQVENGLAERSVASARGRRRTRPTAGGPQAGGVSSWTWTPWTESGLRGCWKRRTALVSLGQFTLTCLRQLAPLTTTILSLRKSGLIAQSKPPSNDAAYSLAMLAKPLASVPAGGLTRMVRSSFNPCTIYKGSLGAARPR